MTLSEDELFLLIEFHRDMLQAALDSKDPIEAAYHRERGELFKRLLEEHQ